MSSLDDDDSARDNKRRRTMEAHPAAVPSAVLSSVNQPASIADADEDGDEPNAGVLFVADLEEIPKLLMEDMQQEDPEAVADAMETLGDLFLEELNGKKNRGSARESAAHIVVLTAMRKWSDNLKVQSFGCRCLAFLITGNTSDVFIKSGGIEALCNALRRFPNNKMLQGFGILSLSKFFCDVGTTSNVIKEGVEKFATEFGGIDMILRSMKKWADDATMQHCCCDIFGRFVYKKELCDAMKKAGAVTAVSIALEKHPEVVPIQKYGAQFMRQCFKE